MDASEESAVRSRYADILAAWNSADARGFAAAFADDGVVIGFDGSQMTGRAEIVEQVSQIFADHPTGAYVGIVREVRPVGGDAALLRAVSGMVPADADDLKPELTAVQSLLARRDTGDWRVVLYQNTPAQYHGRPKQLAALVDELRAQRRQES